MGTFSQKAFVFCPRSQLLDSADISGSNLQRILLNIRRISAHASLGFATMTIG